MVKQDGQGHKLILWHCWDLMWDQSLESLLSTSDLCGWVCQNPSKHITCLPRTALVSNDIYYLSQIKSFCWDNDWSLQLLPGLFIIRLKPLCFCGPVWVLLRTKICRGPNSGQFYHSLWLYLLAQKWDASKQMTGFIMAGAGLRRIGRGSSSQRAVEWCQHWKQFTRTIGSRLGSR